VLAYTAGPEPVETGTVTNDRFPDRKVHAGGWAAKRYSNDVEETWEALRMGRVDTLILTDARAGDAELFIGPEPSHLAATAQELLDLGVQQPWSAPADEALTRAALGTGAEVRFVTGGVEQSPDEGVGALLRYAV